MKRLLDQTGHRRDPLQRWPKQGERHYGPSQNHPSPDVEIRSSLLTFEHPLTLLRDRKNYFGTSPSSNMKTQLRTIIIGVFLEIRIEDNDPTAIIIDPTRKTTRSLVLMCPIERLPLPLGRVLFPD
jgi:hypothetical protein